MTESIPEQVTGIKSLSAKTLSDLRKSGLSDATIIRSKIADDNSVNVNSVGRVLRQHGVEYGEGYVIPYVGEIKNDTGSVVNTSVEGMHYRVKNFNGNIKYLQRSGVGNHVYIPPNISAGWEDASRRIIITEGEKKALKACQEGFDTIGLGGVWSWRNRQISLPASQVTQPQTIIQQPTSGVAARVNIRVENYADLKTIQDGVAPEMSLIDWIDREVVIVFDSDVRKVSAISVQQAAFELGLWLEEQGARVSQINLPLLGETKCGLDDFLLDSSNVGWLRDELGRNRNGFPSPANSRRFISVQLTTKESNKHKPYWQAAKAIISDIDSRGTRYRDTQGFNYYFEDATLTLHQFRFAEIAGSSFGNLLVDRYGVSTGSKTVMDNLEGMFNARGCQLTTPRRVLSHTDSAIYYQLSNSRVAMVTAKGISLVNNGTDGQLFLPMEVGIPIDEQQIIQMAEQKTSKPRWLTILETVNLQPIGELSIQESRALLCCLFYMSPWLLRFRGTQLPIEIAVAEPNSGKTFLYNLRLGMLTGNPSLQGMPNDFRSFVSSVQSANGLWVCDNLGSINREYWERLNDELARLVTEPNPSIELRQLYTTSQVARIPVQCSFAVTSIRNPLTKPDLVQRSIIYELAAIPMGQRNSNWYVELLSERSKFVAEHLSALQSFMAECEKTWKPNYLSSYRLVHFEQSLRIMGKVLGFEDWMIQKIVEALPKLVASIIEDVDVVIQGLGEYAKVTPGAEVQVSDVVMWAQTDMLGTYSDNHTLSNVIRLGKYIKSHASDIETITGIKYVRRNNTTWLITPG